MENIYDKAHELARVLKNNEDVKKYREANKNIKNDETAKKMLDDLRKIQYEAYNEQMKSGKLSKATEERLNSLASVIGFNPKVNEFIQAEMRFSMLWEDLMKILSESIGVDLSESIPK